MDRIPLVTSSTLIPLENFWNSILIYHDRPNVVNRHLLTIAPVLLCEISLHSAKRLSDIFTREALLYEIRKIPDLTKITPDFIKKITETHDKDAVIKESDWDAFAKNSAASFVSIRVLLPRNQEKCLEVVIFDKSKKTATFFAVQENGHTTAPRFPYHIELSQSDNLRILVNSFEDADTSSAQWLADKLFPKLLKWAENDVLDETIIKSLGLVVPSEYCTLYSELKSKYSENLVKQWPQKAKTDPQKYVFEDIAIATYLICLWRKLGAEDVNFVDCGCGNGLLVYILNAEGYKGCGYDIRSRKVWELYCGKADLKIGTITPESVYPDATWLIGNHSDELTPWIPIIALNSSPKTNFFVLPCCSYELNGRKYARINTALSQYGEYLDYVKNICIMCGFTTSIDKLRIPSTKRTCLVGVRNEIDETVISEVKKKMSDFINMRLTVEFAPRKSVEVIRNCTKLDTDLIKRIVNLVVGELLATPAIKKGKFDGKPWNQGGTLKLGELCQKISPEDRKSLKNECGGFQTLLKNHRYIFDVHGGTVSLRAPPSLKECNKYKDKPCWFYLHHPDGCFFQSETCAYKHVEKL